MSGASNQLIVSLGLNSTDFQKKIKVINQKMKEFESEFKKADSAMNKFGDGQKRLSSKLTTLQQKFELSERKVKEYREELTKVQKTVTKHKTAYDKLEKTLEKQRKELSELEKTVGKSSKKYKELKQEIADNEDALRRKANAIANAETRLSRHNTALNNAEKEYNDLKRQIRETKDEINNFKLTQISNQLSKVGGSLKSVGSALSSTGRTLTASVTTPLVAFGTAAGKTFTDYEEQVRRVNAISSSETMSMAERYDYLSEKTREFGRTTEWTAMDVGKAYEYFAMAGKTVEEATDAMTPMLSLATIGMLDLGTAADIVTDTMTPFSKELKSLSEEAKASGQDFNEAEWIIDRFASTITNSNTTIALMGETLKYAGPTVASLGGDFEDLAFAIGIMANSGIKGSMAGTSLSTGLNRLIKPTEKAEIAMKKYGIEVKKSKDGQVDLFGTMEVLRDKLGKLDEVERGRVATTIFGQIAQKGWLTIINAEQKEWDSLRESIVNADGATEKMMNEMKKSGAYNFKLMTSAITDLLIVIGDALAPAMSAVAEKITDMAGRFSAWITKMRETNPQMLEIIGKLALFAAAAGPVLTILGTMTQGLGGLTSGIGKGIGAFVNFKKKLIETAATAATGTSKFGILASAIGVSGPVLIGAGVAALAGLATIVGTNESAIGWLMDKWGAFGEVIARVCEFIGGAVQLTFGNLLIILSTLGKALVALVSGKVWEIDDILSEGSAKMQANTKEAWSNIKMETASALKYIKEATKEDMDDVNTAFTNALKTLPKVTKDNADEMAKNFSQAFKSAGADIIDLSDSTIKILRGTSDTMSVLFSGIKQGMNIDDANKQFAANMRALLLSGETNLSALEAEFKEAGDLISKHLSDGMGKVTSETSKILTELDDVAKFGLESVAMDISSIMSNMSSETLETIRGLGKNWNTLFKGIKTDGSMPIMEMKETILSNIQELGLNTPEKLETFKKNLVTEIEKAQKDAEKASEGTDKKIEDNVVPDGDKVSEKTKQELGKNKKAVEESSKETEEASKKGGENTSTAFIDAVNKANNSNGLSLNFKDKVSESLGEATIQGSKQGSEVVNGISDSMTRQLPSLDGVTKKISDRLSKIDNIRLGNVTKQLSEVNRWLGIVSASTGNTRDKLKGLTNLPFGNTTKGLSQVHMWIKKVSSVSNSARSAMIKLTNLPFGNTNKGLSEVNKWLKTVTTTSKTTQKGLKDIVAVTFGKTTKGLSEINRWLDRVKTSSAGAKNALISIKSVTFGSVTRGLSEINKWLNRVKSTAGQTRTSLASVKAPRLMTVQNEPAVAAISSLSAEMARMPRVDVSPYQLNYNKSNMADFAPKIVLGDVKSENTNNNNNQDLIDAIMGLVQVIGNQQINVGLNVSGKTLATATAPYMKSAIDKLERRNNRLAGI